ncbi:class I SAM-dependent methyltransferase [Cohnella fermenti]|uniref:Class I SAM-dependent methyltransferase n=1 Tax=Cohnella fermenti TaxID=2565925 RepID=A0A4S4BMJ0_9BACL|nr:class I SAM-dependent methyltransferase [Cohnella fermenti]THF76044.1 class I SAM-dependent methyltransferase [Cohnella fermenti]
MDENRALPERDGWGWDDPAAERYTDTIERKIPGYRNLYELTAGFLQLGLRGTERPAILIVGAGGGQELSVFVPKLPNAVFTGVDPSERMLNVARRRMYREDTDGKIQLVRGHVGELPEDERYDAAACLLVLHFVRGREAKLGLLREIARRTKPGAPLCLASLNGAPGTEPFRAVMEAWKEHMLGNGIPLEEWERFASSIGSTSEPVASEELLGLAEQAGWETGARYFSAYLIEAFLFKRSPRVTGEER